MLLPLPFRQGSGAASSWLVTLADLIALLLTFFVMLFAMSTIQADRWTAFTKGLAGRAPGIVEPSDTRPVVEANIAAAGGSGGIALAYLDGLLNRSFRDDPMLRSAVVHEQPNALVISLPADLLFASGSAVVGEAGQAALFRLGGLLANIHNAVSVVGHTDPQPIGTDRYASNWELSLARAVAVGTALHSAGYGRVLPALGAADGRYADLARAIPERRRFALARRVDIHIRERKGR